jgi:hypothetical protein
MPQLTLSDGDLVKKTLRTTLVMVGSTALWLGVLSGAVIMTTGPSASGTPEVKAEKSASGPLGPGGASVGGPAGPAVKGLTGPGGPGAGGSLRSVRRGGPARPEAAHPGDPI